MTDADALLDESEEVPHVNRSSVLSRFTPTRVGKALQVAGGASVSVAAFGVDVLLGWLTAGVCLIVFGTATELEGKQQPSESS